MKVPSSIQNKMHMACKHFAKGAAIMDEVNQWFDDQGIDQEIIRSGNGVSLEEIEYGNDITDEFCEWFENLGSDKIER